MKLCRVWYLARHIASEIFVCFCFWAALIECKTGSDGIVYVLG